jgi:cytochrome c peroxidase
MGGGYGNSRPPKHMATKIRDNTSRASALMLRVTLFGATLLFSACDRTPSSPPPATAKSAVVPLDPVAAGAAARLKAKQAPLSAMAMLGKKMFFDPALSASGKMSCASCHDPEHAFAPGNSLDVQLGGPDMKLQGVRAVPSLTYRERTPPFSIGPDQNPDDNEDKAAAAAATAQLDAKLKSGIKVGSVVKADITTGNADVAAVEAMVPQGGMDWDGRAANMTEQAGGPLLDPREMANGDAIALMATLKAAPYAGDMIMLFGPAVFTTPKLALGEAYFALARYQFEDKSFHPYDSKFDYYLAGRVKLSAEELRGMKFFDDPNKGNCASCHLDKPSKDGKFAPAFTDYQFEALGAPRNTAIPDNRKPHFFDEGLCGPLRKDMAKQKNYCGLFKTPGLRNVATRHVFFHNGVFHSLEDAVRFYVERETKPEKWYPRAAGGKLNAYNDLPPSHRANVDVTDAPFDRKLGDTPALNEDEVRDIVAFMKTLTDGYRE